MPIKRCQLNKKSGYKYGDSGKCYIGKTGLKKAKTQERAIKSSQYREKK